MTLDELQIEYDALCQRIEPSAGRYSFLTMRSDSGAPHVELNDGVYYHVVTERGLELAKEAFTDKDQLLYRLVSDVAFWMAVAYEVKNRVDAQDARRIMFAKWVELMERVGDDLAAKTRRKISDILTENPYFDN